LCDRHSLDEKKKEFSELEERGAQISQKFNKIKKDLSDKKKQADTEAPLADENGRELPLKSQLEALEVQFLDDVEAAHEEAMLKADSIVANPAVIRQYAELKEKIEAKQTELESLSSSKNNKLSNIETKRKMWETSLQTNVAKINALFTKYMAIMGCTGEVGLIKGKTPETQNENGSFKNWGIEIRVSFRENTKAQVLSAQVQSGGERSVSTIMYLMALQDMMVSPFRCVDEINQGLDDRNERLVFKRIVENSTRPPENCPTDHSGQYFLITPKLLPNLYDMECEAMTVLFVFNGKSNVWSRMGQPLVAMYSYIISLLLYRSIQLQVTQRVE
jgi:chromosome segregation ATPase